MHERAPLPLRRRPSPPARGRRAHLRACDDCATFERTIGTRQSDLHALGPWIGGTSLLGVLGLGGGTAKAALVAGGSSPVATGGGLGWGGLPVAIKGFAVAAVVATTGTTAVELPKVATHDSSAPRSRAATAAAPAPAAISANHSAVRERALAQAAARRARAAAAARRSAAAARTRSDVGRATISTSKRGTARTAPAQTSSTSTPTTVTNVLAPAQNLLSGISTTLQNLFGRR